MFFLKSVTKWIEGLQNIQRIIDRSRQYEDVIDISTRLGKDLEFGELHLVRVLSRYCSQNYFANLL
jgi:hypothetical protein